MLALNIVPYEGKCCLGFEWSNLLYPMGSLICVWNILKVLWCNCCTVDVVTAHWIPGLNREETKMITWETKGGLLMAAALLRQKGTLVYQIAGFLSFWRNLPSSILIFWKPELAPYSVVRPPFMFFCRLNFLQFIVSYTTLEKNLINTRNRFLFIFPYICSGLLWVVMGQTGAAAWEMNRNSWPLIKQALAISRCGISDFNFQQRMKRMMGVRRR